MDRKNNRKKEKRVKKNIFKTILKIFIIVILILLVSILIVNKIRNNNQKIVPISEMIGKTANRKFVKIQDANGDIFYLPKGFKISDNETEQTVKDGLVIIDDTGDKETTGSQFIWIPVDINTVFNNNENTYGELDSSLLQENNSTEEYLDIKNSISKYGGFYISRYEAGISEKMKEELKKSNMLDEKQFITKDTTQDFANGKYKPISKSDSTVWNFIKWGGAFEEKASDNLPGNDEANGAVKVARSMYNNSKTSVRSNLCYGYQWDAIMNFIDSNYYNNLCEEGSVILDSLNSGNYSGKINKTSSYIGYSNKNIFDLAGNVWEWTMTGYSDLYRVARGGSYYPKGNLNSISSQMETYPSDYYKELGFRVALWIK